MDAHLGRKKTCKDSKETGNVKKETGNVKKETGNVKKETGNVKQSRESTTPESEMAAELEDKEAKTSGRISCPHCYKTFSRASTFKDHVEKNTCKRKSSAYECPICKKDCVNRQRLYYHRKKGKCTESSKESLMITNAATSSHTTGEQSMCSENQIGEVLKRLSQIEHLMRVHPRQTVVNHQTQITQNTHFIQNNIILHTFSEIQDDYVIDRLVEEFKRRLEQYRPEHNSFCEDPLIRRVYGVDRFLRDAIRHTFFDPDHTENHTIVQNRPYQKYVSIRERSAHSEPPLCWKHTPRRSAHCQVFSRTADQYKRVQQVAEIHPSDDLYTYRKQSEATEKILFQIVEESLLNGSQELGLQMTRASCSTKLTR
jgi:hypothetical protein